MAPFPIETGRLLLRQFDVGNVVNDVGGHVNDVANTAGGAAEDAANTAGGAIGDAAETAGGAIQDAADTVEKGVKTGVEAIKSAADALAELMRWQDQIRALLEAWEKYKSTIYAVAIAVIAIEIIIHILACYACGKCCYECCCLSDDYDHHDKRGACCGLCGKSVRRISERDNEGSDEGHDEGREKTLPPIVKPKRTKLLGGVLNWDRGYVARGCGSREERADEHWTFWGLVGEHGSWFNRQREKDWFPRWLGGRGRGQDWPELKEQVTRYSEKAIAKGRGVGSRAQSQVRGRLAAREE